MRMVAYSKKGTTNMGDNSNAYLIKKESGEVPILGYGDSSHDWITIEKGVIGVFEGIGNGESNAQMAYVAAKELGTSYVWDNFVERNVREVDSKIVGQVIAAVVYIDEMNVVTTLNIGNMVVILLRDGNVEELSRVNKCIMGNFTKLTCKTSFRKMRTGDVLLVLNSGMFHVLYDDILKAAKFANAKDKVAYLNKNIKLHENMGDFMHDSTVMIVYEG